MSAGLWKVRGHGKSGGAVTLQVRANDYGEAMRRAREYGVRVQDCLLSATAAEMKAQRARAIGSTCEEQ